jgi:ubiquinone/menaquinone biosynthesis C-methylase UbiE
MNDPFEEAAIVARYEDWYASPFGAHADREERGLLLEMLSPLGAGATLAEIGCGTAHFGRALGGLGFRVIGLERSRTMALAARSRVRVVRGDAARLPFRDRSFDGAFVMAVLDFVEDPTRVLAEARRVSRERVAVIALAKHSWLATRRRIAALRGNPIFASARFWSQKELVNFARSAGAEPERRRGALVLPPFVAGRAPGLDRRLAKLCAPICGLVAFSLDARR